MIVEFTNSVTGVPVYINSEYVMLARPNPVDPDGSTEIKLRDGETLTVRGYHRDVAARLTQVAA
ncbi:MAG: hypothetical protein JWL77_6563 [Chthonomonadaceae bacterium]|nr:hypothetical protein [Chthonomonadaceae bacterium]